MRLERHQLFSTDPSVAPQASRQLLFDLLVMRAVCLQHPALIPAAVVALTDELGLFELRLVRLAPAVVHSGLLVLLLCVALPAHHQRLSAVTLSLLEDPPEDLLLLALRLVRALISSGFRCLLVAGRLLQIVTTQRVKLSVSTVVACGEVLAQLLAGQHLQTALQEQYVPFAQISDLHAGWWIVLFRGLTILRGVSVRRFGQYYHVCRWVPRCVAPLCLPSPRFLSRWAVALLYTDISVYHFCLVSLP